eukprot:TRINITY_DN2532_c0_g1_i3.p1 TRINITY_DN2532_c0_g1~~TRINITY_DN2532_c0_g1_i3.p1  ORF type:complete len:215 (+),score=57.89 TRINITY_DN2532_c0_g1_i3:306-950(+)
MTTEQPGPTPGSQGMPWDPIIDYRGMGYCTDCWMSIWRSLKPVICKIQGFAVGGGSDIALCCDIIIMEEDAKIGYPPARVWGCPTTAMWTARVGITWAKRILLTGDLIDGKTAEKINLITKAVPSKELDSEIQKIAERISGIPKNQLAMQKLVINQVYEQAGLSSTQLLATIFDGITRHTPEGVAFKARMEQVGLKQAVRERDVGTINFPSHKL